MTVDIDRTRYGPTAPRPSMYISTDRKVPAWAKEWTKREVLFEYEGVTWRIVHDGSHNNTPERNTGGDNMFVEYVRAIPRDQKAETLADTPCTVATLAESLRAVQSQGVMFTPDMLARARYAIEVDLP